MRSRIETLFVTEIHSAKNLRSSPVLRQQPFSAGDSFAKRLRNDPDTTFVGFNPGTPI